MEFLKNLSQPEAVLLAGALGALGAILASAITNSLGHFLSGRIEERGKYAEVRRAAFADVISGAIKIINTPSGPGDDQPVDDDARARFIDAYSRAMLVAKSKATIRSLDALAYAVTGLHARRSNVRRPDAGGPGIAGPASSARPEPDDAGRQVHDRMNEFHLAARRELGIPKVKLKTYNEHVDSINADGGQ